MATTDYSSALNRPPQLSTWWEVWPARRDGPPAWRATLIGGPPVEGNPVFTFYDTPGLAWHLLMDGPNYPVCIIPLQRPQLAFVLADQLTRRGVPCFSWLPDLSKI